MSPDWRERMVEMIRGAAPLSGEGFAGGPTLTPLDQIGIYAEQYVLRLGDAVLDELPGLIGLAGRDVVHDLALAYLADHPSQSFTLNRVAKAFPDWLAARGAPVEQVEMARLDVAVASAFEAADPVALDPASLGGDPVLALQPPVHRLTLTRSVHRFRSAVHGETEPPPLETGHFELVVFRPGLKVRHLVLPPDAALVVDAFATPRTVGSALEEAVTRGADPVTLSKTLGRWFQTFAEGAILGPPT